MSAAARALVLILALTLAACGGAREDDGPRVALTATPVAPGDPATDTPTDEPTDPNGEDTPDPDGNENQPREPTDADRARFVAAYRPPGATAVEHVAVDVDGDGIDEILFVYVRPDERRSYVDVAVWSETEYEIAHRVEGGSADRIARIVVTDVNADGAIEVAIVQRSGASGESMSIWTVERGGILHALRGVGGCYDGRHTYGVTGVELADRTGDGRLEIAATCEDDHLPQPLWSTDVYEWSDGAYHCAYKETAEGTQLPCE